MNRYKSSLFLMELIVSILFFALSGSVCIQLFVKAHLLGQETAGQNQYALWTQNLAELWLACEGNLTQVRQLLSETPDSFCLTVSENGDSLQLSFDAGFSPCSLQEAVYQAVLKNLEYDPENGLNNAIISIFRNSEPAYTLELKQHIAEGSTNIHE